MGELGILLSIVMGLTCVGAAEKWLHTRRLLRIPHRIHVNGTRGKSSVTRLIAAGLRNAGVRTLAKTTGTLPRLILPSSREIPIYRRGRPNVLEQLRVVATACTQGVDALVVECMALQPQLQWLCESKIVRSTHGVITNIRPDHLDVMGPDESDVARALAGTVPIGGSFVSAETKYRDFLSDVAHDRGTQITWVSPDRVQAIDSEILSHFSYREHAQNVATALQVCEQIGVDRTTALEGMWRANPDPGAMTEHRMQFFGRQVIFLNGFAANDPISSQSLWEEALERHPTYKTKIAVFNCRSDRAERSVQLSHAYSTWTPADYVVLSGSGTYIFAKLAVKGGVDPATLIFAEGQHAEEVFEAIVGLVDTSALVVGLGNIGGVGLQLASYFANRSERL